MKKIVKKSAWEEVHEVLRTECLDGKWDGKLPGTRVLGASLGVSPPTVLRALAELAAEGLLLRSGDKRAYQVNPAFPRRRKNKTRKHQKAVLLLTPIPWDELSEPSRWMLKHVKSSLAALGWDIRDRLLDYGNAKSPHKSWDSIINVDAGTPVIALWGNPAIASWAARRQSRILLIGGDIGDEDGVVVGVSSTKITQEAMDLLINQGHRHIVMPLLNRQEVSKDLSKATFKERIESLGEVYQPSYHTPECAHFSRDAIRQTMRMYAASTFPTGFIFFDWRELLATFCYLSETGRKVPRDVSLIYLDDIPDTEWFSPDLVRFKYPTHELVKIIKAWLGGARGLEKMIYLSPSLTQGASIAPPGKSARS